MERRPPTLTTLPSLPYTPPPDSLTATSALPPLCTCYRHSCIAIAIQHSITPRARSHMILTLAAAWPGLHSAQHVVMLLQGNRTVTQASASVAASNAALV